MKKVWITLFLVTAISISSCSNFRLEMNGSANKVKEMKSIAILNVYICPPETPVFPLIDAGIYNGNYNDIFTDIYTLHEKKADTVVKYLGNLFEKYSGARIVYGSELYTMLKSDNNIKEHIKTYPLLLDNEDFPKATVPEYSLNFFDFSDLETPADYFKKDNMVKIKTLLSKLSEVLKVDGILIGFVMVRTKSVGIFGLSGDRYLHESLVFFDNLGEKVATGFIDSEIVSGEAHNFTDYQFLLSEYFILSDLFLRKLYLNEDPKR